MNNSTLKPGKGLKRVPFLRAATRTKTASTAGLLRVAAVQKKTAPAKRATLKSKGPRMTPIRKAARGQDCTMRFPVCNGDRDTVVWAHSNNYRDGKGAGKKARDEEGCFACFKCHSFYDGGYANAGWTREKAEQFFDLARSESRSILAAMGLIKSGKAASYELAAIPKHLSLEQ